MIRGDRSHWCVAEWARHAFRVEKENSTLMHEIGRIKSALRWTPCSEQMPPEGVSVLVKLDSSDFRAIAIFRRGEFFSDELGPRDTEPTDEWHPLPGTSLWPDELGDNHD